MKTINKELSNVKTIVISCNTHSTTWCLQPDGNWRNEDAHSFALNYGDETDEDIRSSEEMQCEIELNQRRGRCVEMR